ncbi:MAG: putative lipid II flippase FtsW [Methyloligellaceae bacterium]
MVETGMRLRREDRSLLSEWWFSVDRLMLGAIMLIMMAGLLVSVAASSPPIAAQRDLGAFYFAKRQVLFFFPAVLIMIFVSLLDPKSLRRAALSIFFICIVLMVMVLVIGAEVNGAQRWILIGGLSLQPSEFAKPAFVLLAAWLFAQRYSYPDMPATQIALGVYGIFALLLILQPDVGQALLITMVWGGLFFFAGLSWRWVGILAGSSVAGLIVAYSALPHVANRINRFISPDTGDSFQMKRALESFRIGGWTGRGAGEGKIKFSLPDSHTDFIFAVVAEEFGIIACLILLVLFAFVVIRGFMRALNEPDAFIRLSIVGLTMLFGLQAIINMSVNLALIPAKGMTLPFISYGGSSMLAMGLTMGMLLGLMRQQSGYFTDNRA